VLWSRVTKLDWFTLIPLVTASPPIKYMNEYVATILLIILVFAVIVVGVRLLMSFFEKPK
jgi:hypothetical protein